MLRVKAENALAFSAFLPWLVLGGGEVQVGRCGWPRESIAGYSKLSLPQRASRGLLWHTLLVAACTSHALAYPSNAVLRHAQVRNAQKAKIPVACVVGKQEVENNSLSVRLYGGTELGAMPKDDVLARLLKASATRSNF